MEKDVLDALTDEARSIHARLSALCETDDEIRALYRGASLWFSPVAENPDVMFLGINPGAAFYKTNHALCAFFEPLEIMEYADDSQSYQLKWEWQYVFGEKGLNRPDILASSAKTNFCYLATEDAASLRKLLTQIRGKLDIAPYEVFGKWTRQAVQQIAPRLLICEGKDALDLLRTWSFKAEYEEEPPASGMQRGRIGSTKVLQVSRVYSTLKDADKIIAEIGNILDI